MPLDTKEESATRLLGVARMELLITIVAWTGLPVSMSLPQALLLTVARPKLAARVSLTRVAVPSRLYKALPSVGPSYTPPGGGGKNTWRPWLILLVRVQLTRVS